MQSKMRAALAVLTITICLASGSALAQPEFGLRAGATIDPDQFHFGAHGITNPLIPHLTFRPNLEIGVGSDVTTVAANFEFAYAIPIPKTQTSVYLGAGPALNVFRGGRNDDTDSGGGFNILIGLEHKDGLFGEIKVGTIDSPELKFTIGYTFR